MTKYLTLLGVGGPDAVAGGLILENVTSEYTSGVAATSITFTITTSNKANRGLIVLVSCTGNSGYWSTLSATHNGTAMTLVDSDKRDTYYSTAIFSLIGQDSGTEDVVIQAAGGSPTGKFVVCALDFSGANQATLVGATTKAKNNSIDVAGVAGDIIVDINLALPVAGQTPGADQTERFDQNITSYHNGAGSTEPCSATGNVTMDWSGGTSESHMGVAVKPV